MLYIYGGYEEDNSITVGNIRESVDGKIGLDNLISRHFAIVRSTGSSKKIWCLYCSNLWLIENFKFKNFGNYPKYLIDNQGILIAMLSPFSGNHHDLYQIDCDLDELFQTLNKSNISTDGVFGNADAGFEFKEF